MTGPWLLRDVLAEVLADVRERSRPANDGGAREGQARPMVAAKGQER